MWKFVQGLATNRLTQALAGTAAAATLMVAGVSTADAQVTHQQSGDSDYHVVAQGDTMWDLSGRYYGDSYEWPRMWSYNAHITNPHWIYPGDIVYLRDDAGGSGAAQPGQQQANNNQAGAGEPMPQGMYLPLGGYITKDEVQYVGRIVASRKEANMLAEHDTAWVGWGEGAYSDAEKEEIEKEERETIANPGEVQKGDRFAVVREVGTLTNDDGEVIAHKYVVLGGVVVTKVSGTDEEGNKKYYDEVKVTQSWQEIYRGDLLIPYERQLKVVKQSKAETDEVAKVIDTLQPGNMFGEHSYVFLDKGAADGVRMGNRFFAYQRYEGIHLGVDRPLDKKVPWTRVGQLLVLDVREHYSTALVIDSKRELIIGDRLEMYNGY
ncbi:LysM peptidoglycan-binding domain-containing protein [Persicimonas caeni]|uniref:LysM peptidoglycan-binding domain-containing protein n=1 Tax=Persicimonas caeni TaxID=2292766 RepID=A0A4Y6Q1U3_PERCE|nr:LysM peptidoglycan-binding domain-containing protein [Persicimonas caeni]QDG54523.1 LysM peptidoglycan-binding domain-containing protein [Persicimonas caeni]QED35744.1 LysM peptidoglycan-binding domain-containing protein [Persicimonas caeni]